MKIKKYQPLLELAFTKNKFERHIIKPIMLNFLKHMTKLKLCDENFGDIIYAGVSAFCKYYQKDWEKQSLNFLKMLFSTIEKKKIKLFAGSKETIYKSFLDDSDVYIDFEKVLLTATDEFPRHSVLKRKIHMFTSGILIYDLDWYQDMKKFLLSLSPKRNTVLPLEEINEKGMSYIKRFVKDFK